MNSNLINKIARRIFLAELTELQKQRVQQYTNLRKHMFFGEKFKNERTYIHVGKVNNQELKAPADMIDLLSKAEYSIVDYRKGIAQKYDKKLNKFRQKSIGKILGELSLNQRDSVYYKKIFDGRLGTSKKDLESIDFSVCITHNPQDVAAMSTGRNWTSCMRLPDDNSNVGGEYYYTALNQVQYGGMCAYLIDSNDKQIERPYARIAIKRLQNLQGDFIYKQEDRIYGDDKMANEVGFKKIVQNVLQESNKQTMNAGGYFKTTDPASYTDSGINNVPLIKNRESWLGFSEKQFESYVKHLSKSHQDINVSDIEYYLEQKNVTGEFINKIAHYVLFSIDFMKKHKQDIDWVWLSANKVLPPAYLEEFKDVLYWPEIFAHLWYNKKSIQKYRPYKEKEEFSYENLDYDEIMDFCKESIEQHCNIDSMFGQEIEELSYNALRWKDDCRLIDFYESWGDDKLQHYPYLYADVKRAIYKYAIEYMEDNPEKYQNINPNYFFHDIYNEESEEEIEDWHNYINDRSEDVAEWYVDIWINKEKYAYTVKIEAAINDDLIYQNQVSAKNEEEVKKVIDRLVKEAFDEFPSLY